ncbi:MAG: octaprenyl diphosphate synthase [Burkholderiales bacterium]|jgi:octaprenyl-diphosphate synthase|nr:octaprenyl diphosphate synthase [Burkholderiales bacterium]
MDKILSFMHEDLIKLDEVIRQDLNSNIPLIRQISEYIIAGGGKRIRPLICLLCGRIAGLVDGAAAVQTDQTHASGNLLHKMAAMVEYIHTATLLHDDVVDESNLRRGRKTANAVFGNAASVLVGDFIYTRAFQMMVEADSLRLLKVMADSTNKISEGEVLQLLNIGRLDLTEAEYFEVIKHKTATLFEASARVAAIVANSSEDVENCLSNYAINLGNAFQVVDDILDYSGNTEVMGKNIGDDLRDGKITLPLIYLLEQNQNIEQIKDAIEKPNKTNVKNLIKLINNSDAISYCKKIAEYFVLKAKEALNSFPDSEYKIAMLELAQVSISRLR